MSQPSMAAGFAASFLDFACARGVSRDALLGASGLTESDLADQDNRIPVAAYQTLIDAAMQLSGDTALLLRHTMETRLETMSIVGQIVHASSSLAHSFEQLNRYVRLMVDTGRAEGDRFELHPDGTDLWIIDHLPVPDRDYLVVESGFARLISEFTRGFPTKPFARELQVTYPAPPHAEAYPEILGVPTRFSAARNALRVDRDWLDVPFDAPNTYVFGLFTRHADALMESLKATDTIRARVETQILPELHEGNLSMDRVARQLGMSRQTLYRRLKDEGVTFAELHDELRQKMARDYLSTRRVSVNEAAYLLGFSEASSFVRAFRRWTGMNPSSFRDRAA
ncbi:AraC family transcriptional regulator [Pararhodobacter sp. CCB-MM2]|uniref:AraC family transcriptional regulator n=1 Tax=Pararhodobacter sp. CCB-MM2 TaxID=1786003 RepID=UPI000832F72C|nr:AraC family transcriptional regulator [Pararhodobacter sp. CCB-MM2]